MTALVVDRPQVIAEAKHYWSTHNASGIERLSFQAGDALTSIPKAQSEKDIFLLSAVLHGFDDATCTTVLRNIANACGQTGARIALLEMLLPEAGADVAGASFDMQMFVSSRGRERTLSEWTAVLDDSGMALEGVVRLQAFGNILVLHPKK